MKNKIKDGRVVLVTGGSGDIGSEICRSLSQAGYKVAIHSYRSKERAEVLARKIGGLSVQADLTQKKEALRIVSEVVKKWGRLDALVNVAGLPIVSETQSYWDSAFEETTAEMYLEAFKMDALGTVNTIQAALPHMKKRKYGKIVNFGSTPAVNGHDKGYPFTLAKASVLALTKSLALELGRLGINVNAIALGTVETRWLDLYESQIEKIKKRRQQEIPMGRIGQPNDIGGTVKFLISPESDWMTGQVLVLDGGEVR